MTRPTYYILKGHNAVPVNDAPHPWPSHETRSVAQTYMENDVHISAVFLVIDHAWDGPPDLFETMIFGGPHSDTQWRYHTWDEAAAGHARIVAALEAGTDPWTEGD